MTRPPSDRLDAYFEYLAANCPPAMRVWTATTESEFCSAVERAIEAVIFELESGARRSTAMDELGLSWLLTAFLTSASIPAMCEGSDSGHVHVTIKHPANLPLLVLGQCKIYEGYDHHCNSCRQLLLRWSSGRSARSFCLEFFRSSGMYENLRKLRDEFDSHRPFEQIESATDHFIKGAFVTMHKHFTSSTVEVIHLGCNLFHPEVTTNLAQSALANVDDSDIKERHAGVVCDPGASSHGSGKLVASPLVIKELRRMSHPIFDSLGYPWHRDDAMAAYRALQVVYPQHAEIDLVYRRCAADLPGLSMHAAPAAIWKQALEALAAARALPRLCEIVCGDPAAAGAHPALRQLAAAGDAAVPARAFAAVAADPRHATMGATAHPSSAVTGHHTLRILHISDLHLRGPREPDRARRVRVLGDPWLANVTELRGDGRFDLVAFTGDVAFSGQLDEYLELMLRHRNDGTVARWLDETLAAAGCGRDDLYVVPGNHDVARAVHAPAWREIREAWDQATGPGDDDAFARWLVRSHAAPRGMSAGLRECLLERTAGYRTWIAHGLGRPDLLPTPSRSQLGYRATRRFSHLPFPVHVIGLDSAWLAGDDHDARKLRLTDEQILRLCTGDDGEHLTGLRIALVHHPLADLADGERARRLLQEHGVDLLLSGHLHDPEALEIATPDGRLRDLAAGCLYQHDRYRNGVTALTLDLDDAGRVCRIELRFRGWSDRGHWHDDDSLYRGSQGGRLVCPGH